MLGFIYTLSEIFFIPGSLLAIVIGYTLNETYCDIQKAILVGSLTLFVATFVSALMAIVIGKCFSSVKNVSENYILRIFNIKNALNLLIENDGTLLALMLFVCPGIGV